MVIFASGSIIELLFVFVEAVFVAPRSEELASPHSNLHKIESKGLKGMPAV